MFNNKESPNPKKWVKQDFHMCILESATFYTGILKVCHLPRYVDVRLPSVTPQQPSMQQSRNTFLLGLAGVLYPIQSPFLGLGGFAWWSIKAAVWLGAWFATGGRRWLHLFRHTWRRDAK